MPLLLPFDPRLYADSLRAGVRVCVHCDMHCSVANVSDEGVMATGVTSAATDEAVQANIIAVGYTTTVPVRR